MEIFAALDVAQSQFEQALRQVRDDQWNLPTPCSEWNVEQVAHHVVAANDYFMALMEGASKEDALERLAAVDIPQAELVKTFAAQRPRLRATFSAPGALELVGHHVVADMTGAQLLRGCVNETTIHTWDITQATSNPQQIDPQLAEVTLSTMEQLAPIFAANGFTAPSVDIPPDAPIQARLIALSGRQP